MSGQRCALSILLLASAFLLTASASSAQSCQSSLNVDPGQLVTLQPWGEENSQSSLLMSCGEAEEMRGKIFREQLAFLSQPQQITAAKINSEISTGLSQLNAARQALASAQTAQQVNAASATIKSMRWLAAKTKLLICAGLTADSGGLALVTACGKLFVDFLKNTVSTFEAFSSASEAHQRASRLQGIITAMQADIGQLNLNTIPGTATPQRFSVAFESLCTQIKNSCLRH